MAGYAAVSALVVVIVTEIAITTWCALWPLRGQLPELETAAGWWALYSFALGNLDLLVMAVVKDVTLAALVLSAPVRQSKGKRRDPTVVATGNHKTVRAAVSLLCGVYGAFLLVKAAAVAVTAPEQLWPQPQEGGGGGGVGGGGGGSGLFGEGFHGAQSFVGLVYLYVSIVSSLLSSLLAQGLARTVVTQREAAWEADEKAAAAGGAGQEGSGTDPLRTPLLAEEGAAKPPAVAGAVAGAGGAAVAATTGGKTRTVSELLRMAGADWPLLLAAFSAGIVAALGAAMVPYLTGQIVDYASIDPNRAKFRRTLVHLVLVAAGTGVFTGTRGGLFTVVMSRLSVRLRRRLFSSLLKLDIGFYDTTKTGEITSRLASDTSTVADQVGLNLNVLLRSATQAAMVLSFMFAASWRLTVVTFILVPVVLSVSQVYGKYYSKMSKRVQAELAAANGVAEEVLSTMTTVKAHAAQDSAESAYASKLNDYYRLLLIEAGMYSVYAILTTFLPSVVTAVVLFYGGNLVLSGLMSPGKLFSFMLYQTSLSSAFSMMGDVFSALTAAVGAAEKVVELMNRRPAIPPAGPLTLPYLEGQVELQGVEFNYPARPDVRVLNGLSLTVQPGEMVALVGPSGGGKSSIVKLLERFYVPSAGRVMIDGHDLGQLDPKWLRRQVALVSQEPVLYARSIRRNIIFGLEPEDGCTATPTEDEIVEAAKQANAHDFITAFPEGYETSCGEKGVALSGGQKQRIAIARALVRRPRVLLLDEATSALDADSEAVVQEALDRVMRDRTVLVIAHRLSTIQNANRIYVIGKGVVQEVGTHADLLAAGGVYAQLVRRQLTRPASQANFLAGSSTDIRPSVSTTSLTSLTEDSPQPQQPQQQQQSPQAPAGGGGVKTTGSGSG